MRINWLPLARFSYSFASSCVFFFKKNYVLRHNSDGVVLASVVHSSILASDCRRSLAWPPEPAFCTWIQFVDLIKWKEIALFNRTKEEIRCSFHAFMVLNLRSKHYSALKDKHPKSYLLNATLLLFSFIWTCRLDFFVILFSLAQNTRVRGHPLKLSFGRVRTEVKIFIYPAISLWNSLPLDVIWPRIGHHEFMNCPAKLITRPRKEVRWFSIREVDLIGFSMHSY